MRVATTVEGEDKDTQIIRRNLIRYACLAQVLALRDISVPVQKRFPDLQSVVNSGRVLKQH